MSEQLRDQDPASDSRSSLLGRNREHRRDAYDTMAKVQSEAFSPLLGQHHDRSWFNQVFRADNSLFVSRLKDIFGGFAASVDYA
jgi:hypothetical protein